jgi:hypothetical protein
MLAGNRQPLFRLELLISLFHGNTLYEAGCCTSNLRTRGNTVANRFRSGGPSYGEVVVDVCKRLGVLFKEDAIVQNEATLLNLYFDQDWRILDDAGRHQAAARASAAAADDATSVDKVVKSGGTSGVVGAILGFTALSTLSVTDPAYRVTAPCVLHVAYLRRKILEAHEPTNRPRTIAVIAPSVIERSKALAVGESNGESLITMARITDPGVGQWQAVSAEDGGISRLNPLLQAAPSLATAQHVALTPYMEVVINGPLLNAKGTEGYRLITMIDGKPSHGTLLDPSTLSNIVNAGAMLQVASFALGQKHLADIKRELNEIKIAVQSVSDFQQKERWTKLTGMIKYLEQVAPDVTEGAAPPTLAAQLESHEPILLSIQDHLIEDIKTRTKEILGVQKAIAQHHARLTDHYEQALLCLRVRAANLQLASLLGLNERTRAVRLADIRETLSALREDGQLLMETDRLMRKKVQALSSMTNRGLTITQRKLDLLQLNATLTVRLKSLGESIERALESADDHFRRSEEPTRLLLKLEGERIVGVHAA